MDGRWISIAAYFNVNGIKVSEPSRPISPMNSFDTQIDETKFIGVSMVLRNGERLKLILIY